MGDSCFEKAEYKRALNYYQKALDIRKSMKSYKVIEQAIHDLKEKLGHCYFHAKNFKLARSNLESLPTSQRRLPVLMKLGQICEEAGEKRLAMEYYKEGLKIEPSAFEILEALVRLGVDPNELSYGKVEPWVVPWLELKKWNSVYNPSHSHQYYGNLGQMHDENTLVELAMAEKHYRCGEVDESYLLYSKIHHRDKSWLCGMDPLANLLRGQRKWSSLNRFAEHVSSLDVNCPETWVVLGWHCDAREDSERALELFDKAIDLNKKHHEAYVAKGIVLTKLLRAQEALQCYRRALVYVQDLNCYRGIVDCYEILAKYDDGVQMAKVCLSHFPGNARALALLGTAYSRTSNGKNKATEVFKKAMQIEPHCTEVVVGYVSFLIMEYKWKDAVEMLVKHIPYCNTGELYSRLGGVYVLLQDCPKALECYHNALSLDPDCNRAKEGLARLEKLMNGVEDQEEEGEDNGEELIEGEPMEEGSL